MGGRLRAGLVPLYPMGVGDVLDTAFRLLRATAAPSALLILLVIGPIALLTSIGFVSPAEVFRQPVAESPDTEVIVLTAIGGLLALLVRPLVMAGLVWLGARADEGSNPGWQQALRAGWRRYWQVLGAFALLAAAVIVTVVVGGLFVALAAVVTGGIGGLLAIPLVFVAFVGVLLVVILGHLVVPVVVVEELGPIQGLRRAWALFRRRFWAVVGYSLLVGIVVELLGSAVSFVVAIPAFIDGFVDIPGAFLFVALSTLVDGLITVPLASFAALAIYVDLRIRTEGYDVAVLAGELRR